MTGGTGPKWLGLSSFRAWHFSSCRSRIAAMGVVIFVCAMVLMVVCYGCAHTRAEATPLPTTQPETGHTVDFGTDIKPILEAKCQPCHFSGGKVYQKLPFDRSETVKTLGAKLFTRIKDENDRRLIREFLAQP